MPFNHGGNVSHVEEFLVMMKTANKKEGIHEEKRLKTLNSGDICRLSKDMHYTLHVLAQSTDVSRIPRKQNLLIKNHKYEQPHVRSETHPNQTLDRDWKFVLPISFSFIFRWVYAVGGISVSLFSYTNDETVMVIDLRARTTSIET